MSGVLCTPSLRNLNLGCDRRLPPCAWSLPVPLGLPVCFCSSDLLPPGTSSLCCSSVPPPPGSLPKLPRQNSLPAVHALCMQQAHTTFYPARNAVLDAVSLPSWSQCRAGASGAETAFSFLGPMDPVWGHLTTKAGGEACAELLCEPLAGGSPFREGRARGLLASHWEGWKLDLWCPRTEQCDLH